MKRYRSQPANYHPVYTPQKKRGRRRKLKEAGAPLSFSGVDACMAWTAAGWPEDAPYTEALPWWKEAQPGVSDLMEDMEALDAARRETVVDSKAPIVYTQWRWSPAPRRRIIEQGAGR